MKKLLKNIPNLLTLTNLTLGVLGILYFQHDLLFSVICLYLAMVFDFLDGFAARIIDARTELGLQLDSLSDVISFGVLPACIVFGVIYPDFIWMQKHEVPFISYLVVLIPIFSALRLAKFNIDKTQKFSFKGLPTPANAFWIASIPLIVKSVEEGSFVYEIFANSNIVIALAVLSSVLLVLPIPLFSFKFKNYKWHNNKFRYLFLITTVILFLVFKWVAFPLIIFSYILISLISNYLEKKHVVE